MREEWLGESVQTVTIGLLRIRRSWLQIVSAHCPIPPTPLYTRGAWPVRTDTQYVQPTKQQFTGLLTKSICTISYISYLISYIFIKGWN